jgi:hypothetical protein
MIDGTKLRLRDPGTQQRVRAHHLLAGRWRSRGHGKAGHERFTATWQGWTFTGDAIRCWEIRGSFHKAHHQGTNWQDYMFTQFLATVAALRDAFGLHPSGLSIVGLEIGVNLVPPMPTRKVLRAIVLHRTTAPTAMHMGHGIEIKHAAFKFKVYDKAHQYDLPGELLRFELKFTRARPLHTLAVRTVADLLDLATWHRLGAFLLAKFDELLIMEPLMPTDALRPAERVLVTSASAPAYWQAMDNRTRWKRRGALDALHQQHMPNGLKVTLRTAIVAKLSDLSEGDICHDGTPTTPDAPEATNATRGRGTPSPPREGEKVTNATLAIRVANVPAESTGSGAVSDHAEATPAEVRRCPVCGRDISHQHPTSRVCSERLYGKEGKKCRNALSNRALSLRRMAARGGLLFDHRPYVQPPGRNLTGTTPLHP